MPRALITVGSTKFDLLIQSCLSEPVLSALKSRAFTELVIQSGNSQIPSQPTINGLQISIYTFKPSLSDAFAAADLVISHAGSGTIIEVLRLGKPLIIVPNPTLMDNHQLELAEALSSMNVCKVASIEYVRCLSVSVLVM